MPEGSVAPENVFQKAGNWLADKIAPGGLPTIPETNRPLFPDLSPSDPKPQQKEQIIEPPEKVLTRLKDILQKEDRLPEPGKGININLYSDTEYLFGQEIHSGTNGHNFISEGRHEFTKLWHETPQSANTNEHQKELYKKLAGQHKFFTFVREFPGGWTQEAFQNKGNLDSFLKKGGLLQREQIASVVAQLRQMQEIAGEPHGDLVHPVELITDKFDKKMIDLDKYDFDSLLRMVAGVNLLISPDDELIIPDFGGAPKMLEAMKDDNTKTQEFCSKELAYFEGILNRIYQLQQIPA